MQKGRFLLLVDGQLRNLLLQLKPLLQEGCLFVLSGGKQRFLVCDKLLGFGGGRLRPAQPTPQA
jgi:hypothetical protein